MLKEDNIIILEIQDRYLLIDHLVLELEETQLNEISCI